MDFLGKGGSSLDCSTDRQTYSHATCLSPPYQFSCFSCIPNLIGSTFGWGAASNRDMYGRKFRPVVSGVCGFFFFNRNNQKSQKLGSMGRTTSMGCQAKVAWLVQSVAQHMAAWQPPLSMSVLHLSVTLLHAAAQPQRRTARCEDHTGCRPGWLACRRSGVCYNYLPARQSRFVVQCGGDWGGLGLTLSGGQCPPPGCSTLLREGKQLTL